MWWWLGCAQEALPPDRDTLRVEEFVFVDPSRATPALADLEGADSRTLRTRIWIGPSSGEDAPRRPLLVLAHGHDGLPEKFEAFATDLANDGLVVAAPAFPATHYGSGAGIVGPTDLANQPGDLSFVLDALLEERERERSALWHAFDPDAIAVLGHSLGGATVLGLTRFDDPDPRFRVTATLSPATPLTVVFGPAPSAEGPPILLMHGIDDLTVSYAVSEQLYADLDDPVWLLGIAGGGHSDPIESQEVPPTPQRAACMAGIRTLIAQELEGATLSLDTTLAALADQGHETAP